ncbi:flagellar assembly peptidoglycan hydrolase FlgJ [Frateuria aurantia]
MTDINIGHSLSNWTDLSGFDALREKAGQDSKGTLPAVARQFEAMFTQMMLKSMRDATPSDPEMDSQATDTWRDLYDQQLSLSLTQQGKGLGIADMLIRELGGHQGAAAGTGDAEHSGGSHDPAQVPPGGTAAPVDNWAQRIIHTADTLLQQGGKAVAQWSPDTAFDFVRDLAPHAMAAARKLGLSFRLLLAQAALETHWGRSIPSDPVNGSSFNLFGIKAGGGWTGHRVNVPTLEYEDGIAVKRMAQFRAYSSAQASFDDYAELIGNDPRYAQIKGHGDDVLSFASGLVDGGYATDPNYAAKVMAIANSPLMQQALSRLKNLDHPPTQSAPSEEN